MKLTSIALPMILLVGLFGYFVIAQTEADFSGLNEVPPVNTSASGDVEAILDGDIITIEGSFEDLESDLFEVSGSAAHIHSAPAGENGPIIFNLNVTSEDNRSGIFIGTEMLTDSQIDDFNNGMFYVNIHTVNNTGGEIRVQFVPEINETNTTNMTNQTNGTNQTNATKITICHKTGSATNLYNEIEINQNALNAHLGHGDIYPVPLDGCPPGNQTNATGRLIQLNIHRWYPKGPDYVYVQYDGA